MVPSGSPTRIASPDSLLPSQLWPQVVDPQHENRLLGRLPLYPIFAPSIEYVVHYSTTGAAAIVTEGRLKPEIVMNTDGCDGVTVHALRHLGATLAARAGATLAEVQARLGHSTAKAAMQYQHSWRSRQAEHCLRVVGNRGIGLVVLAFKADRLIGVHPVPQVTGLVLKTNSDMQSQIGTGCAGQLSPMRSVPATEANPFAAAPSSRGATLA